MADTNTQPGTQPLYEPDVECETHAVHDNTAAWGLLFWLSDKTKDLERLRYGKDCYSVGRSPTNDIVLIQDRAINKLKLKLENLSRLQFKIKRIANSSLGHQIILEDCAVNSTFVNGCKVGQGRTKYLNHGDEIALICMKKKCFIFLDAQYVHPGYPADISKFYVIVQPLGKGSFGEVFLAVSKQTGTKYAIKTVRTQGRSSEAGFDALEQLRNEAAVLCALEHPCIVNVHDIVCRSRSVYLILELMGGGDLHSRIKKKHLRESTAKFYFIQLLLAVEYCHKRGIVHRDLKPENILLSNYEDDAILKITDFGLSKLIDENTLLKTYCGTPLYLAPEVIAAKQHHHPYTAAVDVWSLGVILFTILSGYHPFQSNASPKKPLEKRIVQGDYTIKAEHWSRVSSEGLHLVQEMLQVDPDRRPTIDQIFQHRWMSDEHVKAKVRSIVFKNETENAYLCSSHSSSNDNVEEPSCKRRRNES